MFIRTTAINKLLKMTAMTKVVQGGTSSGKTFAIIPIIIDKLAKNGKLKATVVAETLPSVKEGALDIFKNVMQDTNRWIESNWNASSLTYTFGNKSRIQFKSFDTVGKAKSSGKRQILFLNEANHIPYDIADALMIRSDEVWIDYNPDDEFWVHTEVLKEDTSEFALINFEDNEALPDNIRTKLLAKKDKAFYNSNLPYEEIFKPENIKNSFFANWCRVYIFGRPGRKESTVFDNWNTITQQHYNSINERKVYGVDWGKNHGFGIIEAKYDSYNNNLYCHELNSLSENALIEQLSESERHKINMTDGGIIIYTFNRLQIPKDAIIVCDSARPDNILLLRDHGWEYAVGIDKPKGSVMAGITLLHSTNVFYTETSKGIDNDYKNYQYAKDRLGVVDDEVVKKDDDCIDPIRYIRRYLENNS